MTLTNPALHTRNGTYIRTYTTHILYTRWSQGSVWLSLTCSVAQASASHLRPVFAQHVIALDAEVRDKYSQMAEEEKQRRLQVRCTGHFLYSCP